MRDGAVDDLLPGVDDRLGLLAAEHHAGDLRGIGQVGQPGFVDRHARLRHPLLKLLLQGGRHLVHAAAERQLVRLAVIVGVGTGQVPHGRLALDVDVGLVVVDVEAGLERILHPPDHDGRDFDRVAPFVVDFEFLAIEVSRAERDAAFRVERIGPVKAALCGPCRDSRRRESARGLRSAAT